jgi:hypothetical protein
MNTPQQIAKNLRDAYNGGNWAGVNLRDTLKDVTWQQAITKIGNLNTIAMLVFHINYYVDAALSVLKGHPLNASDKYSFDLEPVNSGEDWQKLVAYVFSQAEAMASEIEQLDEARLSDVFADANYGTYFRNMMGVVEHAHYHLGQIVLIKKLINEGEKRIS